MNHAVIEPLVIRLTADVGKLPEGFTYSLPRFQAERLLARRVAIVCGNLHTIPDVALTEEECQEAGIL